MIAAVAQRRPDARHTKPARIAADTVGEIAGKVVRYLNQMNVADNRRDRIA
jgi:hypothetical protein